MGRTLQLFPTAHAVPPHFSYSKLFVHLRKVADQAEKNKMTPQNLAVVFGPTVFQSADAVPSMGMMAQYTRLVDVMVASFTTLFGEDAPAELLQRASTRDHSVSDERWVGSAVAIAKFDTSDKQDEQKVIFFAEGDQFESVSRSMGRAGQDHRNRLTQLAFLAGLRRRRALGVGMPRCSARMGLCAAQPYSNSRNKCVNSDGVGG